MFYEHYTRTEIITQKSLVRCEPFFTSDPDNEKMKTYEKKVLNAFIEQ